MKKRNILVSVGIIIYVVSSIIDRFFYKIPDYVYIPIAILGILIIIVGFIKAKK